MASLLKQSVPRCSPVAGNISIIVVLVVGNPQPIRDVRLRACFPLCDS